VPEPLQLSLDFEGVEEAASSWTKFGQAIEGVANKVGDFFKNLTADKLKNATAIPGESTKALREYLSVVDSGSGGLATYLKGLEDVKKAYSAVDEAAKQGLITQRDAERQMRKLNTEYGHLNREAKIYGALGGGALGRAGAWAGRQVPGIGAGGGAPGKAIEAMGHTISETIGSAMRKLTSVVGLGGGLFGLLVMGRARTAEMAAEAGQILDLVTGMGDEASRKITHGEARFLTGFQRTMDKFSGIAGAEVRTVLKSFGDAGYSVHQVLEGFNSSMGLVGKNFLTVSLALDKHYNIATGTSAKLAISLAQDYGNGLRNAQEMLLGMAEAGEKSHIGVQRFMTDIMNAAGPLKQYGVNVANVVQLHQRLQHQLENMGLDKATAGVQASIATGQITSGIAGLSQGMQAAMASRMGMGGGLEGMYAFREGISRMTEGGDKDFLVKTVKELRSMALEMSGGDPTRARFFLQQQGVGFEGARGIIAIGDKLEEGKNVNQKELHGLRDSFKSEQQKVNQLHALTNAILDKMAKIAMGILRILVGIAAAIIYGIRAIPALIAGGAERATAMKELGMMFGEVGKGWDQVKSGFTGLPGLIGKLAVGGSGLKVLERAISAPAGNVTLRGAVHERVGGLIGGETKAAEDEHLRVVKERMKEEGLTSEQMEKRLEKESRMPGQSTMTRNAWMRQLQALRADRERQQIESEGTSEEHHGGGVKVTKTKGKTTIEVHHGPKGRAGRRGSAAAPEE